MEEIETENKDVIEEAGTETGTDAESEVEAKSKDIKGDRKPVKTEFIKLIQEFIPDLNKEFPEVVEQLPEEMKVLTLISLTEEVELDDKTYESYLQVYNHSLQTIPNSCLNIMYENEDMFDEPCEFILGVSFSELWKTANENTKTILWKYMQLFLFMIMPEITDTKIFGENTFRLFEMIDEEKFKEKINDTMKEIQGFFDNSDMKNMKQEDIPDVNEFHDHLKGLFDGKLGSLAKEISDELYEDMDFSDLEESLKDSQGEMSYDVLFKKLMNNPSKMFNIVQSIQKKIQTKIQSGEINESELMKNAYDMMSKMKSSNIPGMDQFGDILKSFGGADLSASKNNLSNMMKKTQQRERMQKKLEQRRQKKEENEVSGVLYGEGQHQRFTVDSSPPQRSIAKKKKNNKKKKKKKH